MQNYCITWLETHKGPTASVFSAEAPGQRRAQGNTLPVRVLFGGREALVHLRKTRR